MCVCAGNSESEMMPGSAAGRADLGQSRKWQPTSAELSLAGGGCSRSRGNSITIGWCLVCVCVCVHLFSLAAASTLLKQLPYEVVLVGYNVSFHHSITLIAV